jgi:PAS domain S-box-containing protein
MNKDKQKNDKSKVQSRKKASNSKLKTKNSEIRKRAEKKLRGQRVKQQAGSFKDAESVIHELQVHQIELEMQNEELRNAQIQLEESRKKYSDLYDFAPVGYFTFDKNGLIIEVNLTGAGQLGAERNLLIRKPFSRFIHKDDQDVFFLHRSKVFETKTLQSCEIRLKKNKGAEFYSQLESIVIEDSDSKTASCRTTVSDISYRKLAEESLRISSERYRSFIEVTGELGWTTNAEGEVVEDQPSWTNYTGQTYEEIKGWGWSKALHPDDLEHTAQRWKKAVKEQSKYEVEYRIRRHDGVYRHFMARGTPVFKEDGSIMEWVGTCIDITERRQAATEREELLKELERSNRALELYSYTISHDLRAPLRSIEGFAQAILEDYTDKLDETGKDYLNRVTSASRRMSQLIDALLTMARLARAEIKEDTVDLSSIAQVIAYELKKRQPERKVEFIIAEKVKVKGDPNLLRMALENFLDNAWKFTGKHPSARIEFGVTKVDGKDVCFVRDDGAGFDMNFVDKLFSPFRRIHGEAEFPGIGIGLATVHKIINKHGGKIWAESQVEKGATFYFTLE